MKIEEGDIVQINPEKHENLGGYLLIVTQPTEFGCQGYLMYPHNLDGGVRYQDFLFLRLNFDEFEKVGKIEWMPEILTQKEER